MLNTHRTAPDNQADAISLKTLIQTAEGRIRADFAGDKAFGENLLSRIRELAASVDHQHNLESLILFVNQDVSKYTRLPIPVVPRVSIDDTFATRDLVRAMHAEAGYYILVFNQQDARLIEAFNDKPVGEVGSPFPIHNSHLYSTNKAELSNASKQTSLAAEFFNRIDKELNKVHQVHPLPVVICADASSYFEYLKIADKKDIIIGHINQNGTAQKTGVIVETAWKMVKTHLEEKTAARFSELEMAMGSGKCLVDVNDIWSCIKQGRGRTLFVKNGLFLPATIENDVITLISSDEKVKDITVDDMVDELIEENLRFGGDVVFLDGDKLDQFNGLVLTTRY